VSIVFRSLAAVAMTAAVFFGGCQGSGAGEPANAAVEIFAAQEWYRARPEREEEWEGVLEKLDPTIGPAGRTTLTFALRTGERRLPIYAAGVQDRLAPYVGRSVLVTGKLVDLSSEGLGKELWVATIRPTAGSA
jgi:hypothetical protein